MSPTSQNSRQFNDARSREYSSTADDYTKLWERHIGDVDHYKNIRTAFMKWQAKAHLADTDGAIVVAGPGFQCVERDISAEMLAVMSTRDRALVGADWSPDILEDFDRSVSAEDIALGRNTLLTQRDFSGGVSSRLHKIVNDKLCTIRSASDLKGFVHWLQGDVGYDEVMKVVPEMDNSSRVNPRVSTLDIGEPMDFSSVLQGRSEVRFLIANMLLAGMLAATEHDVRDVFMDFVRQGAIEEHDLIEAMQAWHDLVRSLNTRIATNFVLGGLSVNPKLKMFLPTDVNTSYKFDTFDRIDQQELRRVVTASGYKFADIHQWTQRDDHETPPHRHQVKLFLACNDEQRVEIAPTEAQGDAALSIEKSSPIRLSAGSSSIAVGDPPRSGLDDSPSIVIDEPRNHATA